MGDNFSMVQRLFFLEEDADVNFSGKCNVGNLLTHKPGLVLPYH
jgi:hypothetical protein